MNSGQDTGPDLGHYNPTGVVLAYAKRIRADKHGISVGQAEINEINEVNQVIAVWQRKVASDRVPVTYEAQVHVAFAQLAAWTPVTEQKIQDWEAANSRSASRQGERYAH